MDCDVMGCAFAFIKDLEVIQPKYNIDDLHIYVCNGDDIEVYIKLNDFNMSMSELFSKITELAIYHYGLIVGSSYALEHMHISFDFDYIYSLIGIYDDEESHLYNPEIYKDHMKATRGINENVG